MKRIRVAVERHGFFSYYESMYFTCVLRTNGGR